MWGTVTLTTKNCGTPKAAPVMEVPRSQQSSVVSSASASSHLVRSTSDGISVKLTISSTSTLSRDASAGMGCADGTSVKIHRPPSVHTVPLCSSGKVRYTHDSGCSTSALGLLIGGTHASPVESRGSYRVALGSQSGSIRGGGDEGGVRPLLFVSLPPSVALTVLFAESGGGGGATAQLIGWVLSGRLWLWSPPPTAQCPRVSSTCQGMSCTHQVARIGATRQGAAVRGVG